MDRLTESLINRILDAALAQLPSSIGFKDVDANGAATSDMLAQSGRNGYHLEVTANGIESTPSNPINVNYDRSMVTLEVGGRLNKYNINDVIDNIHKQAYTKLLAEIFAHEYADLTKGVNPHIANGIVEFVNALDTVAGNQINDKDAFGRFVVPVTNDPIQ